MLLFDWKWSLRIFYKLTNFLQIKCYHATLWAWFKCYHAIQMGLIKMLPCYPYGLDLIVTLLPIWAWFNYYHAILWAWFKCYQINSLHVKQAILISLFWPIILCNLVTIFFLIIIIKCQLFFAELQSQVIYSTLPMRRSAVQYANLYNLSCIAEYVHN